MVHHWFPCGLTLFVLFASVFFGAIWFLLLRVCFSRAIVYSFLIPQTQEHIYVVRWNKRKSKTHPVTLINKKIGQEEENSVRSFQGSWFTDRRSTDREHCCTAAQNSVAHTVIWRWEEGVNYIPAAYILEKNLKWLMFINYPLWTKMREVGKIIKERKKRNCFRIKNYGFNHVQARLLFLSEGWNTEMESQGTWQNL